MPTARELLRQFASMLDSVPAALAGTVFLSTAAFLLAERGLRPRWRVHAMKPLQGSAPYRASKVAVAGADRAPPLVRAAALSGILLGSVAVPGVAYAIETFETDGIAVSLLPGVACAIAVWISGWLLLARSSVAVDVARTASMATTAAHIALLLLSTMHVVAARLGWSDRPSLAYVLVAYSFALFALPQAALLRRAVATFQAQSPTQIETSTK
jgi:hypothetical protein